MLGSGSSFIVEDRQMQKNDNKADEALDRAFPPASLELLLEEQNELLEKLLVEQKKSNERLAIIGQVILKLINPPIVAKTEDIKDVDLEAGKYVTYPDKVKPLSTLKEYNEIKSKGKRVKK